MNQLKSFIIKTNPIKLSLGFALYFSFPITGFIHGLISAKGCDNGIVGLLERIFIGFIGAFTTLITLGAPWNDESGSTSTNIRIYVLITFILLSILFYLMILFFRKRITRSMK